MVLALLFMVVFLILASALFKQTTNFLRFSTNSTLNEQANNMAEAGIEHAIWQLNATAGSFDPQPPNDVFAVGTNGKFKISVTTKNSTTKTIKATGYIPDEITPKTKRTIQVDAVLDNSTAIAFGYAIQTGGNFMIDGTSSLEGSVAANNNIGLLGSAPQPCPPNPCMISGDAYAGGMISSQITAGSKHAYSGTHLLPEPTGGYDTAITTWQADAANVSKGGGTTTGNQTISANTTIGPRKYTGNVTISGSAVVKVKGPVYIQGILTVSNTATMQVDESSGTDGAVVIVSGAGTSTFGAQVHLLPNPNSNNSHLLFFYTSTYPPVSPFSAEMPMQYFTPEAWVHTPVPALLT